MLSRRLLSRAASLLAAAGTTVACCALLASSAGCKTTYDLEDRETPVQIVLEAPAAARGDVSVPVLVYVGDRKAVDRVVHFPAGKTTIETPMIYLRAGTPTVSVVLQGREVATQKVKVRQPTWILVRIENQTAQILVGGQDPRCRK
jgi:hypothetical protein